MEVPKQGREGGGASDGPQAVVCLEVTGAGQESTPPSSSSARAGKGGPVVALGFRTHARDEEERRAVWRVRKKELRRKITGKHK